MDLYTFLNVFMIDKLKRYNLASVNKISEKFMKNYKSNVPLTEVCMSRTVYFFSFITIDGKTIDFFE